jgi:formate dehydrogenase accessory protein FdhD
MVIEEVPVALVYNGISHAVMLASPADLEDLAIGFSLTEGIVPSAGAIYDVEVAEGCAGIELRIVIATCHMVALKQRRRALAGRTGCGLCGVESLSQAMQPARVVRTGGHITAQAVDRAFSQLNHLQVFHRASGAAHAAGFADWQGHLHLLREDVGRHNALDKLVGAMSTAAVAGEQGIALVTSRASYEMVHKTAAAGIRMLAALSAPTAMAVRAADQARVTLVGFAGRGRKLAYAHPERLG